ncbi:hypothetical protein [Chroococcidiopsis sp. SAG 2025]|uniref:hypothetical protein n=1 Tax=Chroococcidiopsis sp. SAG 2025 TaxID=171389 RepID=UPI002936E797|nr:hypothetical protein [Chroococcidiopsis sp. SAG 2025]
MSSFHTILNDCSALVIFVATLRPYIPIHCESVSLSLALPKAFASDSILPIHRTRLVTYWVSTSPERANRLVRSK